MGLGSLSRRGAAPVGLPARQLSSRPLHCHRRSCDGASGPKAAELGGASGRPILTSKKKLGGVRRTPNETQELAWQHHSGSRMGGL